MTPHQHAEALALDYGGPDALSDVRGPAPSKDDIIRFFQTDFDRPVDLATLQKWGLFYAAKLSEDPRLVLVKVRRRGEHQDEVALHWLPDLRNYDHSRIAPRCYLLLTFGSPQAQGLSNDASF